MHTLFFDNYRTGNDALDLRFFLEQAVILKAQRLVFSKGELGIDPAYAFNFLTAVSNHGFNGPKRAAVLLNGTRDLELDFGGSTMVCNGAVSPFILSECENITIRNLSVICKNVHVLQGRVALHGDGFVELDEIINDGIEIINGKLYARHAENLLAEVEIDLEYNGQTWQIEDGTGDANLGKAATELNYEFRGKRLRISGITRYPNIDNRLVFSCSRRINSGFFCNESKKITLQNICLYSANGMGVIAQMSEDIFLDGFHTRRREGYCYSLCADATHFVHCSGVVRVENCTFHGQFDDALNIHGIYTRITDIGTDWIIVREMHPQTTGIKIYHNGDKVQALNAKTLLPHAEFTVQGVQYLNHQSIKLYLSGDFSTLKKGDDIENISRSATLIFRGNRLEFNRARGMLIATRGRVLIENNYFCTSGSAIKFESDGEFWFESGATEDVSILNNTFYRCKYGDWGTAVIEFQPRTATVPEEYYHKKICIENNKFDLHTENAMVLDNIRELTIKKNQFTNHKPKITTRHIGKYIEDFKT